MEKRDTTQYRLGKSKEKRRSRAYMGGDIKKYRGGCYYREG
jgi:hypothetical protein